MANKKTVLKGFAYRANDGRFVRVGYCEEKHLWFISGRTPHKKELAIMFSREAMQQIIVGLINMSMQPEMQEELSATPNITWTRFNPRGKVKRENISSK